ncbi:hypothetical protein [[Ruminococcus] lactaris]|uniref:hypothetical protein n=1 Tax=[Ruminococcus] lactaris TaxID=46228 RepID=UPI0022DFA9F6|nr:hypothetical protein [[Ruminococcus] lactaris]
MEKTVKHFCTTAKRIKKDAVEFAKQATMIAGMSAMVVTKMELQRVFRLLHRELRLQAPDWQSQDPH